MSDTNNVYVVASGKGGVGKSTFVAGISKSLCERGYKVLAIDCDIGLRSLDAILDCSERVVFDWGDCLLGHCSPEMTIIRGDIDFIAAPRFYDEIFVKNGLKDIVSSFASGYDYVFLDAPAGIDSGFLNAVGCADKAILVTTPDNVCVRSCNRAMEIINETGIDDVKLVINMFEKKPVQKGKLLTVDECIDETGVQLIGIVPLDRELAFSSVTGNIPGEFSSSDQAFYRIAGRIVGEKIRLILE